MFVTPKDVQSSMEALMHLHENLNSQNDVIPINCNLKPTKGDAGICKGYLFRDKRIEHNAKSMLHHRIAFNEALNRYRRYDAALPNMPWPEHFPMRLLQVDGCLARGENIFLFFPEALGVSPQIKNSYSGFEFIDVWNQIYEQIVFPCLQLTADPISQFNVFKLLKGNIETVAYLASVFHEVGHRAGPWKISPVFNPEFNLNKFQIDILGELATDALLVVMLREFPEIAAFVFCQRIFWFGRRGFAEDKKKGLLNQDNDAWIGAYLWNKAQYYHVIYTNKLGMLEIDLSKITILFQKIISELDQLAKNVLRYGPSMHIKQVEHWMQKNVNFDNQYFFDDTLALLYERCGSIIEKTIYTPAVGFHAA